MRLSNFSIWLARLFGPKELEIDLETLEGENDPYEMAKRELEEELEQLDKESEEIDKKLTVALTRLKRVDALYKKVMNGDDLNDLEAGQRQIIRIKN